MDRFPGLKYSVSATTRKPRANEVDGKHYYFQSRQELEALIASGGLVEHMEVHGNLYGTPRAPLDEALARGESVVLDLDVYGKKKLDRAFPDAVGILISPPSLEVLEQRLRKRGTDTEDAIRLRLDNARRELDFAHSLGKYEYEVINDDFDRSLEELTQIFEKEMGRSRLIAG
jgi:guanylate kinase